MKVGMLMRLAICLTTPRDDVPTIPILRVIALLPSDRLEVVTMLMVFKNAFDALTVVDEVPTIESNLLTERPRDIDDVETIAARFPVDRMTPRAP